MRRRGPPAPAWIALLVGGLLTALGIAKLQHQIELSAHGVRAQGKVVDFLISQGGGVGASADFEVTPPGTPPFRVHIEDASSMRNWDKGITLNLVCAEPQPRGTECEVDAFADRWLEPMLFLITGLPALLWGGLKLPTRNGRRPDP
jgi:hypothetical protein